MVMSCRFWTCLTTIIENAGMAVARRHFLNDIGARKNYHRTMRHVHLALLWLGLFAGGRLALAENTAYLELTNVLQLRQLAKPDALLGYRMHLEGDVLWANPATGKFVLQDASGAALLEMDLSGQPVQVGQRVRVIGRGTVGQNGGSIRLGVHGAVVDNDGVHVMQEKSGAVWLKAGRHPLRLDWFNGTSQYGLEVTCSGPGWPRQKIPDAALFHLATDALTVTNSLVNGLDYECFEVADNTLPDFSLLPAITKGVAKNFFIGALPHPEHIGVEFSGLIEVPQDGLYTFYIRSDDGSRLFIDAPSLQVQGIGQAGLPVPQAVALGQVLKDDCEWIKVSGTVTFASEAAGGLELELRSSTGAIHMEVVDNSGLRAADLAEHHIGATGVCVRADTSDGQKIAGILLVSGAKQIELLDTNAFAGVGSSEDTNALRVLTTAAEVHQLKREEAQRGYPVHLRGVVTCVLPDHLAFTIQDATRGLYAVDLATNRSRLPEIGSFVSVRGQTDPGLFAPVVNASELTELGAGVLPAPVRPTWDQLLNGSLDAQYVEVQGIVTAVNTNGVTLLMREGRINVELRVPGLATPALARFENSLVRLRGCLFANWDYITHEVKAGEVRIYGVTISVDEPAPADLFVTPKKSVGELLLFDPHAGVFTRVKVSGQILHAHDTEFFMTDGQNGLRFVVNKPAGLAAGDLVEVVGFPELSGISPVLREAVVRKVGHAPLPPVKVLPKDDLIHAQYDSAWVQVRGTLVSVRDTPTEHLLEIQNGLRTFVARLANTQSLPSALPIGCQLELNGVYSGQGGNKAVGQDITSFELLLNRPTDIKVLTRPPWWNLERMLVMVGALACVLIFTVLWITQLHRKVEARTAELEVQIKERQRVEQQRVMEQERARVAQDLHDELGSSLTEISMLAARARAATATDEKRRNYLEQMSDKAREIVAALDEIVWAMNPRHDSMASLMSYFCLYADRFLSLAGIAWRLEENPVPPDFAVDSRSRHQLFLAFKEALTNVVRHSHATEVRLRIGLEQGEAKLSVTDNGCGLPDSLRSEEMDGVTNMRARVEKLGGRFELRSQPGHGTTLNFSVPANKIL
jgi:signal transduction histidine kinase